MATTTAVRRARTESRANTHTSATAKTAKVRGRIFTYIALSVFGVIFMFPLVFMFVSSLKPDSQILQDIDSPAAFLPVGDISLDNYFGVFDRVPVAQFLFNSVFVTVLTVGLGLIVNSMAGFALSRLEWRGRVVVLALVIATLIVPFETIAVPMVYWVAQLPTLVFEGGVLKYDFGWLNTYQVQIVPFIANAFSIFLFTQYFSTIPKSLDEAARIDGASWFTIYRRILVPLSGPAFATVAILTFLPAWNQYLWPLMVVQKEELRPVMVGMQYFFQLNTAWGEVMAYTSLITLPVLIVFLVFQRAFVSSIAASGVKG
jgi:multiple sugar transport system permease protein